MAEHTTTTTTTTTTRSATFTFNINYITSLPGILKLLEIVFGLICWSLIASLGSGGYSPAFGYVMFTSVTSWVLTIISLFIYLLALHATTCSGAPWAIMEFGFNAFWSILYFIAACIIAANTYNFQLLGASAAFGFFATFTYIAHTFISFRDWRGGFPWQATAAGATVSA